jgi:deoxyribose-phosphate aldolase
MLEMPLLDPSASPVAVAQAAALAEAMGVARLLCHPTFVRTVAEAMVGATTGIATPVGLDCAQSPARSAAAAALEARRLVGEGANVIGLVWHASQPSTHALQAAIRATVEALAQSGATVRVGLDTTAMTAQQITTTVHEAIDAGADSLSAGAWCTGRARLIDALRVKQAAPGHTVGWAANLRDLDAVLVARAEGIDLVRGAADLIIRQALQRSYDGPIPLPWPGRDYLSWTTQLTDTDLAATAAPLQPARAVERSRATG